MNLPTIFIPTLGRVSNQPTYTNLPPKLKRCVVFVVRSFEEAVFKKAYPEANIAICPESVVDLCTTREFIKKLAGNTYHWVMDDDITRVRQRDHVSDRKPRWQSKPVDWDELLHDIDCERETAHCIGLASGGTFPMVERMPYKENIGGLQWFIFNGAQDVDWTRVELCEDVDALLQMINSGKRVIRFEKYFFYRGKDGAEGGQKTIRTKERHNAAHHKMAELWPGIVKATLSTASRKGVSGYALSEGRDPEWLFLRVQWSKAVVKRNTNLIIF